MARRRIISNRGLLDYPLRKVVRYRYTDGGNPNTNPARAWWRLECGHSIELTIDEVGGFKRAEERKAFRCEECGKKPQGKPLIEIL